MGPTRDSGSPDRDASEELPFEEGVRLARRCAERLREAERRIQVLSQDGGGWAERDFEPPEDEG